MVVLPILQKNNQQQPCQETHRLPLNYMSDYSVLGLVVDRLDAALRILKEKEFEVQERKDGWRIGVDGAGRLSEITDLFQRNDIDYTLSDVVEEVYQG